MFGKSLLAGAALGVAALLLRVKRKAPTDALAGRGPIGFGRIYNPSSRPNALKGRRFGGVYGVKPHKSPYKGVSVRPNGRFTVNIWLPSQVKRHVGTFDSEIEAALAYDAAAREVHGPGAWQNSVDGELAAELRDERRAWFDKEAV